MIAQTGDPAVRTLEGNKLYQKRARAALPVLVRQAKARQPVTYKELADELGMPNPRNLNYVLGCVGNSLLALGETWGRRVPPIEALVLNGESQVPGSGVAWFTPDADAYRVATLQQKKEIVRAMLTEVFLFPDWDQVLVSLGLDPLPPASLTLPPLADVIAQGGAGEGEAHMKLKMAVAEHPEWFGLPMSMAPGATEVGLFSGDRVDVVFSNRRRRVAIEVKALGAPTAELQRGLFQCVKYQAVLVAEAAASQSKADCRTILALGGELPSSLGPLRSVLGVEVRDSIAASPPYADAAQSDS